MMPQTSMAGTERRIWGGQVLGRRTRQEDAWTSGQVNANTVFAVIADGLGGHADGDKASRAAVQAVRDWAKYGEPLTVSALEAWLLDAVEKAHEAVQAIPVIGAPENAPGSTLLLAVRSGDTVGLAHVGDSRAYWVPFDAPAMPLTTDMTPAGDRVKRGEAPWEHQNTASDAHVVWSCLGGTPWPVVDVTVFEATEYPPGVLLLTSDGLNGVALDAWAYWVRHPAAWVRHLARAPWPDNATFVVLPSVSAD